MAVTGSPSSCVPITRARIEGRIGQRVPHTVALAGGLGAWRGQSAIPVLGRVTGGGGVIGWTQPSGGRTAARCSEAHRRSGRPRTARCCARRVGARATSASGGMPAPVARRLGWNPDSQDPTSAPGWWGRPRPWRLARSGSRHAAVLASATGLRTICSGCTRMRPRKRVGQGRGDLVDVDDQAVICPMHSALGRSAGCQPSAAVALRLVRSSTSVAHRARRHSPRGGGQRRPRRGPLVAPVRSRARNTADEGDDREARSGHRRSTSMYHQGITAGSDRGVERMSRPRRCQIRQRAGRRLTADKAAINSGSGVGRSAARYRPGGLLRAPGRLNESHPTRARPGRAGPPLAGNRRSKSCGVVLTVQAGSDRAAVASFHQPESLIRIGQSPRVQRDGCRRGPVH